MSLVFEAVLSEIQSRKVIKIPLDSSEKLPSRGMVMVQGTLNGTAFTAPLEPDGRGSHWFEVNNTLSEKAGISIGQEISLDMEAVNEWTEPELPEDIMNAITKAGLTERWSSLTTKARWEWLRWIRSTNNPATRQKRIDEACSKLQKGDRRPCCFDATRCTVPELSKSGVLLD